MAPSFDYAVSSLLCAEEDSSVFDDNNGSVVEEFEIEATWRHGYHRSRSFDDDYGDMLLLPLQSDECLALILEKECHHLPINDYLKRLQSGDLDLGARQEAFDRIAEVHAHFGFGPLCLYLSINYLDRFLSAYELPKGKVWMMQLLAVSCLSLAAKMEETEVPLCLDLQVGESKFLFEPKTIQRMELLVLSTLKWRMQTVTPFSFLDYFIRKINDDDNQIPHRALILRSTRLITSTIKGIDFLEFKPSEIAAAVAISFVGETKTVVDTEKAISVLTQHVKKERVLKCIKMLNDSLIGGSIKSTTTSASLATSTSLPQSPIGVLDAACLSYKRDETTVGSCANSSHSSTPDTKRRKLNTPYEVEL